MERKIVVDDDSWKKKPLLEWDGRPLKLKGKECMLQLIFEKAPTVQIKFKVALQSKTFVPLIVTYLFNCLRASLTIAG